MKGRAALARASPEEAWRAFTDPARMPEWFHGARDVDASADFPGVGSRLSWRVGRWRFEGRVVECAPPLLLRQDVRTPSARSMVTHRLVQEGGAWYYEKEVRAQWNGWLSRLLAAGFVARSVRKEAERVARVADARGA